MISNPKFYKRVSTATSKLVATLTDFEEGSENYEACVEFSLSQFQNHKFLDVDSHRVTRQMNGMREKFIIHSQPEKAEILEKLQKTYLSSNISSHSGADSQIHYALLSIVLNQSKNPVNTEYVERTPKTTEAEEFFDWTKYLLDGEELLHPTQWAWDDTPPLSDDEDIDSSHLNVPDIGGDSTKKKMPAHCEQAAPFETVLHVPNDIVIQYWNTAISERRDMNEVNIIREVLWLLSGQENLSIFPVYESVHTVYNELCLSHMTMPAMKSMLKTFARHGDYVQNMRKFVFLKSNHESQTYQAFSESLLKYLKRLQEELVSLEKSICKEKNTILMGDVLKILSPRLHEITVLQNVLKASVEMDTAQESCAKKVSRLLGELHNAILDQMHSSSRSALAPDLKSNLLQIWVDAIRPYIGIIDNWVTYGCLNDPFGEFVLQRSESIPDARSEKFWYEAFSLAADCMQYLSWLQPVLDDTILAGKSVEVLASLGRHVAKVEGCPSLYDSFIESIGGDCNEMKDFTKKHCIIPPSATCDSLLCLGFERMLSEKREGEREVKYQIDPDHEVPIPILIQRSFSQLIQSRCQKASDTLLQVFMESHSLEAVLGNFHRFHLMGWGDVMYDFTTSFFRKISSGEYWEDLMSLRASLQEAISESRPNMEYFNIAVILNRDKKQLLGGSQLVQMTNSIELYFRIEWPLNIAITEKCIKAYNTLFSYLLQVKRALFCLENLQFDMIYCDGLKSGIDDGGKGTRDRAALHQKAHRLCLLRTKILRLVSHWHNFIMTSVIQAEKETFIKQVKKSKHIDGVIAAHSSFLERMCTLCLLKQEKQADKMIQGTLQKIFHLCIVLHTKWNRGVSNISLESIRKHEAEYKECSEFLGIILQNLVSRGAVPLSLESLAFCLMS